MFKHWRGGIILPLYNRILNDIIIIGGFFMQYQITKEQIDEAVNKVFIEHTMPIYQNYLDFINNLSEEYQENPLVREEVVLHQAFVNSMYLLKDVLHELFSSTSENERETNNG